MNTPSHYPGRLANRCIVIAWVVLVGLSSSCVVGVVGGSCTKDPEFAGQWVLGNVQLSVAHTLDGQCGLVAAHGTNSQTGSRWDRLVITGTVTELGEADGDAVLFSLAGSPLSGAIARSSVSLQRQSNVLSFSLSYTINGQQYQEAHQLTKLP